MRNASVVVLALLLSVHANAQVSLGKIEGRLLDKAGAAIEFANVIVSGPTLANNLAVMSTSGGYFALADLPPGLYTVRIFHIAYGELIRKDVNVDAGKTTSLGDLVLTEGITEMSPIVVSASRTEQPLEDAPVAITVITAADVETMPVDGYQDLFRTVPGANVALFSAGDMAINARRATGTIATGTLAMINNRTIYNDFNGQVWWNTLPIDPSEIKRVEVQRGPGSAVWGANATDGVINIITKAPKEMQGATAMLGAGELETAYGSLTYAGVKNKFGYKATGGYYEQGPYDRPTGIIPGTEGPANPGGTPYPPYPNRGTEQLKLNGRVDYDQNEQTTWSASGGYAAFTGLLATPGGPATFDDGSFRSFGQVSWQRKTAQVNLYSNYLDAKSGFLLSPGLDPGGTTRMVNIDFSENRLLGERNLLTYGANARHGEFDLALTPNAPDRDELGAFLQDQIRITDQIAGILGARVDDIDPIGTRVSPRTSLLYTPFSGNTFRFAYNRAFRAPSNVELFTSFSLSPQIVLPPPVGPLTLTFPYSVIPNPDLEPEVVNSFEFGWVGNWNKRVEGTLSVYYNEMDNVLRSVPAEFYTSANPPPGWPLPDSLLDVPPPFGFAGIPSKQQVRNVGKVKSKGVEASLALHGPRDLSLFLNYSWQDFPETEDIPLFPMPDGTMVLPLNIAPEHRFNGALVWDINRVFANAGVTYQDKAFWTDVLDSRFWGPTDSFVATNLAAGVRLSDTRLVVTVNANNIFDERVQQHVFSDIITRKIWAQVVFRY